MLAEFRAPSILQERNRTYCLLALLVLFSSGFGVLFAATAEQTYFLMMRMAGCRPVSIVGSFMAVFVPYFVSVLVVTNSKLWLAYTVIAVRLFLFTTAAYAISDCYCSAAWLIGFMFLFSDIFLIPMLIHLVIQRTVKAVNRTRCLLCLAYVALIGIINFCAVSPLLANLLYTYESMGRYAIHVGLDWRL